MTATCYHVRGISHTQVRGSLPATDSSRTLSSRMKRPLGFAIWYVVPARVRATARVRVRVRIRATARIRLGLGFALT